MDDWRLPKPRLALLLEHFAAVEDVREPWRVAYPLREMLFLAVCATIANCDDYEDIVDWGEANLNSCAALPITTSASPAPTGFAR